MRTLTHVIFISILLFCFSNTIFAQNQDEPRGDILVVTTAELAVFDDGSTAEFDSLNQLYTDKVLKKNEHILWSRNAGHLWGHNSSDYVIMYAVKTFADVTKANERNNELFEKAWPTEEARKKYNDAVNKYFTGQHSDEIYQELKSGRK